MQKSLRLELQEFYRMTIAVILTFQMRLYWILFVMSYLHSKIERDFRIKLWMSAILFCEVMANLTIKVIKR